MTKMTEEEMIKIAKTLDAAAERAISALTKAGVPELFSQSACVDAISHQLTHININNQSTHIAKAAVFALHCENCIHLLLSRLFNLADISGLAKNDKQAFKAQTVVIASLLGHAIDGCLVSTEGEEEARGLLDTVVKTIWDSVRLKRQQMDMEEESNTDGSSSIH